MDYAIPSCRKRWTEQGELSVLAGTEAIVISEVGTDCSSVAFELFSGSAVEEPTLRPVSRQSGGGWISFEP
jgi:hypothetical protein